MPEPAFVFVADSHLDEYTFTDIDLMRGDTYYGFRQAVKLACDLKVPLVAAGDNWECNKQDHPTATTVAFFAEQMNLLKAHGLMFYYVNGQHDRAVNGISWPQAVSPNVAVPIHMQEVKVNGLTLFGMDAVFSHELSVACNTAASIVNAADNPILVCHQRWKELLKFDGAEDGRLADIPDVFRIIITGDMHVAKVLKSGGKDGSSSRTVISPGTQARRSSTEPDKHYAWVMYGDRTYKPVLLKERQVLRLKITTVHDVDAAADARDAYITKYTEASASLPTQLAKPLLIVKGSPTTELLYAIRRIYGDYFHVKLSGQPGRDSRSDPIEMVGVKMTTGDISVRNFIEELSMDKQVTSLINSMFGAGKSSMHDIVAEWRKGQL